MLGGGFALARGGKVSGMSAMLGQSLNGLKALPFLVVLFLICLSAQVLTEFTSNVAIANVMLPVLAQLSAEMEVHPLFLMFPAALSCSMAFHLPVGTPPNAIVAGVANIPTKDMVSHRNSESIESIIKRLNIHIHIQSLYTISIRHWLASVQPSSHSLSFGWDSHSTLRSSTPTLTRILPGRTMLSLAL